VTRPRLTFSVAASRLALDSKTTKGHKFISTRNEASAAAVLPENTATQLYIAGKWRDSSDGDTFIDLNPTTEEPLAVVAAATAADVDAAVRAARSQLCGEWGATPGVARGKLLNRIADLIERDGELLARLEALDVSKPISQPKMLDIPNAAATFRHFAGWADKISGATIPTAGYFGKPTHSYTVREPVGVIGAVIPWNTPLMIAGWKIAPALAAGNTVVVKPPEDAPLSILHLARLIEEAGVPAGVVSVLPGLGAVTGDAIVDHPDIDKISFTGSPRFGRIIAKRAANTFKRTTLELGGKSPQIILADADLDAAVNGTAMGLFFNQGQICAAGTRVLSCTDHCIRRWSKGFRRQPRRRFWATPSTRPPQWVRRSTPGSVTRSSITLRRPATGEPVSPPAAGVPIWLASSSSRPSSPTSNPTRRSPRKRSSVQAERSCPSTPPRKPSRSQTAPCTDWLRVSGRAMCPTRTSWLRRFELALCG
jgi:hypothetical protein